MTSRVRTGIGHRGMALAVFAFAALVAGSGSAADIADLRIGDHADYTRVVLELDQAAGYRLVVPQQGGAPEVVMQVNASSEARQLQTKSPLVREVTVAPAERGSTVRIGLSTSSVQVSEMILSQPPRIVLDLRPTGASAPATSAARPPADVAEAPSLRAEAPSLRAEAAASQAPAAMPEPASGGSLASDADAAPREARLGAQESESDEIAMASAELAAAAAPMGDAMADGVQAAEMASESPATAPPVQRDAAEPRPPVVRTAPRPAPEPAEVEGGPVSTPVLVGVGVFLLVMAGWMVARRRSSRDDDPLFPVISADDVDGDEETQEADEPMAADAADEYDEAMATEPVPVTGGDATGGSTRVPVESGRGPVAFGGQADGTDGVAEEPETSPGLFAAVAAAEAEAQAAEPAPSAIEAGLSKRIHELEERLETLVESRERLERQVAAQTEELRVQRAAIARTQRVVRGLTKGEEEASEPVPRQPN